MIDYDEAIRRAEALFRGIDEAALLKGRLSESDTRADFVTPILRDILGWPTHSIVREVHSTQGFADYILSCPRQILVVEAKKLGIGFSFPLEKTRRRYTIAGLKSGSGSCYEAIEQARRYADDNGIEYGCVTNGAQWLVFRAITRGAAWRDGQAIVFRSLADVLADFIGFWNLLSFSAVQAGGLRSAFSAGEEQVRTFLRPLEGNRHRDEVLTRNVLSPQLQPLIDGVFRDITGERQAEVLRDCYVADRMVEGIYDEVQNRMLDTVPAFAKGHGFKDIHETDQRSGAVDRVFKQSVGRGKYGATILLLGGVGCGKTTFIHRFFKVTAAEFVEETGCLWFSVAFTDAPLDKSLFADFVRASIRQKLDSRYSDIDVWSLRVLQQIYAKDIERLSKGVWAILPETERQMREGHFLEEKTSRAEHVDEVLKWLRSEGRPVSIVIDNVDQRPENEQVEIFLLARELCVKFDAIVFVALREESFFSAFQGGAFDAYHNMRYHIASPNPIDVLRTRLDYAERLAKRGDKALQEALLSGTTFSASQLVVFLKVVNESLSQNPAILHFIRGMSQGDMRAVLDMFNEFMVSGNTHVERMLEVHASGDFWRVAEHEFIKAVMLDGRRFYQGSRSVVGNLFDVSTSDSASNLTSLRVLSYLYRRRGSTHKEGAGFVTIEKVYGAFEDCFGDSGDLDFHLEWMLRRRLIESDNRQVNDLGASRYIRISERGVYYRTLATRFVYLELIAGDTPVADSRVSIAIRRRVGFDDLYERIAKVAWVVGYLEREEAGSLEGCPTGLADKLFSTQMVRSRIRRGVSRDIARVVSSGRLDGARVERILRDIEAEVGYAPLYVQFAPNADEPVCED